MELLKNQGVQGKKRQLSWETQISVSTRRRGGKNNKKNQTHKQIPKPA